MHSVYSAAKEFLYDYVVRAEVVTFAKVSDTRINIRANPQRWFLKGSLHYFEPYTAGVTDSGKFVNLGLTKVSVMVNGSPNMLYNNGIEWKDMWEEASRFFVKTKTKRSR